MRRPSALAALIALSLLLVGCGGDDGDDGAADGGSDATEAMAGDGGDAGSEDAGSDDGGSEDGGDEGAPAEVPPASEGIPLSDILDRDDLTPEQLSDLQIMLSVLGAVGDDAAEGYVTDDTIVVQAAADGADPTEQFLCIAIDQLTDYSYGVVVLTAEGEPAAC